MKSEGITLTRQLRRSCLYSEAFSQQADFDEDLTRIVFYHSTTCMTHSLVSACVSLRTMPGGIGVIIEIPETFSTHVEAALIRLQGQYPAVEFRRCAKGIEAELREADGADRLRSAVMQSIYREKIYAETLSMGEALVSAIMK